MAIDPNNPPSHLLPQFVLADPFPGSEPLVQLPLEIQWTEHSVPDGTPVDARPYDGPPYPVTTPLCRFEPVSRDGFQFQASGDCLVKFVVQDEDGTARTVMTIGRTAITVDPATPCDKAAEEVIALIAQTWPEVTRVTSEASAIEVLVGLSDQRFAEVMVKVFAERMSRIVFSSESSTPR